MTDHGTEVWSSRQWLAEAVSWLDQRLAEAGIERTGDVEQPHLRPWATAPLETLASLLDDSYIGGA